MPKPITADIFPKSLFYPISLRGVVWDSIPYVVWQRLFDFYRAGKCPLNQMSNMMVDFKNCEEILPLLNSYSSVEFIWGMSPKFDDTVWISQSSWKKFNDQTKEWEDKPGGVMPFVYLTASDIHILVRVTVDDVTFKEIRKNEEEAGITIVDHV